MGISIGCNWRIELVSLSQVPNPTKRYRKGIRLQGPFGDTKLWVGYDICSYEGFYCENPPGNKFAIALASIDFNSFKLNAPILDGFINKLPDITLIHANTTNFIGTIASQITKLPYLYEQFQ